MDRRNFIDLFSGCGGLSLGLSQAGWQGIFAIERSPDAFDTFRSNFCRHSSKYRFDWPEWLPQKAMTTAALLRRYQPELRRLRGSIDLVAGGPPCQGFSNAGKRDPNDPRNKLFREYIRIVCILEPKYLLFENVRGFDSPFDDSDEAYSDKVARRLGRKCGKREYRVYRSLVNASDFGIPQFRSRYIMIAVRADLPELASDPFAYMERMAGDFRGVRGLNGNVVGVREAIGDLEIRGQKLKMSAENSSFRQIKYTGRRKLSAYQRLMRSGVKPDHEPNSLRLANHTRRVAGRFRRILRECPRGVGLSKQNQRRLGMKKQCFTPLHPARPAGTITTLPDDMMHYNEPRILTVRENARLQSFPDWFDFRGNYTTGGCRRKTECPRYTQVGNAVPPLMAEAIGEALLHLTKPAPLG